MAAAEARGPAFRPLDLPSHIGLADSRVAVGVPGRTAPCNSVGRHVCHPALSGCRAIRGMSV